MQIAVLEDDSDQADLVCLWLKEAGHECRSFATGKAFTEAVSDNGFDLLMLDWMLPDTNGLEVLEWARAHISWPIPVLFVTQRDSEEDIVAALEGGADDYMTKPVKQREMVARITALQRRSAGQDPRRTVRSYGSYTVDTDARTITNNGQRIDLTQKEYELAVFLFNHLGSVMSRPYILEQVWGRSGDINTRTVDTHISRIRKKLDLTPANGWRLSAIYQYGYRLERLDENGD